MGVVFLRFCRANPETPGWASMPQVLGLKTPDMAA
jgi:hypothetical protein